jgi:hypothetical protein
MSTSKDLKKGSVVEIRVNLTPEKINHPIQVTIERVTAKFIWFKYNQIQRMGRTTFQNHMEHFGYKIISI